MAHLNALDRRDYRNALGRFATGVTVVTTCASNGLPIGVTANSFTSVSMAPPLVSWNYRLEAAGLQAFLDAEYFAIHVLSQRQKLLSPQFSSATADRFAGVDVQVGLGNLPIIPNSLAIFECRKWSTLEAGDHVILLGEVLRYSYNEEPPLVFHGGTYTQLPEPQLN